MDEVTLPEWDWQDVWQAMGQERRQDALVLFVEHCRSAGDLRARLEKSLARALRFRPQSVAKLAPERLVNHLHKHWQAVFDDSLCNLLFSTYFTGRHPEMLGRFLSELGIPHGVDGSLAEYPPLPDDATVSGRSHACAGSSILRR